MESSVYAESPAGVERLSAEELASGDEVSCAGEIAGPMAIASVGVGI